MKHRLEFIIDYVVGLIILLPLDLLEVIEGLSNLSYPYKSLTARKLRLCSTKITFAVTTH